VSKVYSQLIGNMLTDCASAVKYWYFVRVMGNSTSHLVQECALQTHPNLTIISEECGFVNETFPDIVSRIADLVEERAKEGKNYGCVIIPEGLLGHISSFKQLIKETNKLLSKCDAIEDILEI
jgi:6-phosphofructokinase